MICVLDTVILLYQGRFYVWCAKNSLLHREYCYIEDRYFGVLYHTFYCYSNFWHDIAYLSLYRGYRYIKDRCIGVPLYWYHHYNRNLKNSKQLPSFEWDNTFTSHSQMFAHWLFYFCKFDHIAYHISVTASKKAHLMQSFPCERFLGAHPQD